MSKSAIRQSRIGTAIVAAGMCVLASATAVQAQSNVDGYIYGSAAGDQLIVINENLGIRRSVSLESAEQFRVTSLPIGEYTIKLMKDGREIGEKKVVVNVGAGSRVAFEDSTQLSTLTISGAEVALIDFSQTEAVTIVSEQQVDALPVPRDLTSVALLAPGTTQGDSAFGNFASFGGASVAENAVYVNGFNVTDFRTGLGFTNVPFEMISEFQVKTGGYGAEFGRSLGGVMNTTTKRGTNNWEFGINAYFEPDSLREDPPSTVLDPNNPFPPESDYVIDNRQDAEESWNYNIYGGGAIIKDRLFFYALANLRDTEEYDDLLTQDRLRENKDPFYGAKVDFNVMDGHLLELTYLSDERDVVDTQFDDDPTSADFGKPIGKTTSSRGGKNLIARYTAHFGDLSASALYGKGELNLSDQSTTANCPLAADFRGGTTKLIGCWTSQVISDAKDEREVMRLDFAYPVYGLFGDHNFRAGIDVEQNQSDDDTEYSGGIYYAYRDATPGAAIPGTNGNVPAGADEVVRERNYSIGGSFEVNSSAIYIEDTWSINQDLSIYLGLRNETFENKNGVGGTFIKIDNQLAPRLGLSWDVVGQGTSRFFANYGRYYLPVASNTNVRLAGGENFTERWYQCGPDGAPEDCTFDAADGRPTNQGSQIGDEVVYSDGEVPNPLEILDRNIEPMYQDEIILGFQKELGNSWLGGLRFIRRDLARSIEDVQIDHALTAYAAENNIIDTSTGNPHDATGEHVYVLTNPGQKMTVSYDFNDGNGLQTVTLTPQQLQYPEAQRYYNALEFFFERMRRDGWFMEGSYTWSQSYGNSEGYVRSDNGQDDAGITTNFDTPGLTYAAYGYLPNDRRHKLKLWGGYEVSSQVLLSANFLLQSGRPRNAFGDCPASIDPEAYGGECFFDENGNVSPRGSRGTTPWIKKLDLGLRYSPTMVPGLKLGVDVFNVTNEDTRTEVYEVAIEDSDVQERFGLPAAYQTPRFWRFSAEYQFGL